MERDPAKPSDGKDPFRLEDENAPAAQVPAHVVVPPPQAGEGTSPVDAGEERVVDVRTVRERLDPSSLTVPGPLAPPRGWPREALAYPWRGRGGVAIVGAAAVFAIVDVLAVWNYFLGAFVKIPLLVWALAWQTRALLATAVGSDRPPRAWKSDDLEGGTLAVLARVGVRTGLYLLPALVAFLLPYLRDPKEGTHDAGSWMRVGAFAAAALCLAPIVLLGSATGNSRMTWPWGAIPWLFRGFRIVLAAAGSWVALVLAEIVVARLADSRSPAGTAFAVCLPMRLLALSLLLSGGRALGVLGRRYAL